MKRLGFLFLILAAVTFGCSKDDNSSTPTITDNSVKSVVIGTQVWSVENLSVEKYRNGDIIPQATRLEDWHFRKSGAWCYYDFDPKNGAVYGKLYNWYAVTDPRGLAPAGWHVPSAAEWDKLAAYLGGADIAGEKMKDTITDNWPKEVKKAGYCGFKALPGGYVEGVGYFHYMIWQGFWWTTDSFDEGYAYFRSVDYEPANLITDKYVKGAGCSIRLIKN